MAIKGLLERRHARLGLDEVLVEHARIIEMIRGFFPGVTLWPYTSVNNCLALLTDEIAAHVLIDHRGRAVLPAVTARHPVCLLLVYPLQLALGGRFPRKAVILFLGDLFGCGVGWLTKLFRHRKH